MFLLLFFFSFVICSFVQSVDGSEPPISKWNWTECNRELNNYFVTVGLSFVALQLSRSLHINPIHTHTQFLLFDLISFFFLLQIGRTIFLSHQSVYSMDSVYFCHLVILFLLCDLTHSRVTCSCKKKRNINQVPI